MAETKDPEGPPAYDAGEQQQPPYPQQAQQPYPVQTQQPYPQQPPVTGQPMPQGQYPPPQGQYPPQAVPGSGVQWQPQQPTAVVINMPVRFTPMPMNMKCSNCGETVTTHTEKVIGPTAWLTTGALCLFLFGCLLCPLGLIALCIPAVKDTIHTCPNCKFTLGKHSHI